MKSKILFAAFAGFLIYSCGTTPKVTAMKPDPVQVPPRVASPNEAPMSEDIAQGKIMYENKCAACHRLYAPKEFSKEDWQPILIRMQKKARLEDHDMAKINNYIFTSL